MPQLVSSYHCTQRLAAVLHLKAGNRWRKLNWIRQLQPGQPSAAAPVSGHAVSRGPRVAPLRFGSVVRLAAQRQSKGGRQRSASDPLLLLPAPAANPRTMLPPLLHTAALPAPSQPQSLLCSVPAVAGSAEPMGESSHGGYGSHPGRGGKEPAELSPCVGSRVAKLEPGAGGADGSDAGSRSDAAIATTAAGALPLSPQFGYHGDLNGSVSEGLRMAAAAGPLWHSPLKEELPRPAASAGRPVSPVAGPWNSAVQVRLEVPHSARTSASIGLDWGGGQGNGRLPSLPGS